MTVSLLPPSPSAFAKAIWGDVAPYFDDLAARPLDPATIAGWLREWSRLEELVTEAAARAMIAYTIDTGIQEKEADHLRFSTEVLPRMEERSVELARRLLESGYSTPDAQPPPWPGSAPRSRSSGTRTSPSSPSWRSTAPGISESPDR